MFNPISAARASYDDGNWCGTKPGPHPHFDLGSIAGLLGGLLGGARGEPGDNPCGNGILHFPPPPPPPLGEAAGVLSHVVQKALGM